MTATNRFIIWQIKEPQLFPWSAQGCRGLTRSPLCRCLHISKTCNQFINPWRMNDFTGFNQSINQSKPVTPRRRWVHRQMLPLWWSPIDACPLLCGAMMTSTCPSMPWCCPSTIYAVHLCDAFRPRSPVVWSLAPHHGDRHGRTMITCGAWRLKRHWLRVSILRVTTAL